MGIQINQTTVKREPGAVDADMMEVGATFIKASDRSQLLAIINPSADDEGYDDDLEIYMRVSGTVAKKGKPSSAVCVVRLSDGIITSFDDDDQVTEINLDVRIKLA